MSHLHPYTTRDEPRMYINIEDYLRYARLNRVNEGFDTIMETLRGPRCAGRLHWGKAGRRDDFAGWKVEEYGADWCHFGKAARRTKVDTELGKIVN